jgi:two-component system LytT family response regulator
MKINTVIVDDEALSRRGIELRLREAEDFNIVAQCTNGREALAAISTYKPDLVFLDIQMPGMSGFEVVAQLPQESLPVLVFVTAYDQYAIKAFASTSAQKPPRTNATGSWRSLRRSPDRVSWRSMSY